MGQVAIDPISSVFGGKALTVGSFMYPSMEEKLILHADLNSAHSSKEAAILTCRTAEEEKDDVVEKRIIVHLDSKSTFTKVAATYAQNHHGQGKVSQATAWTQAGKGRTACKHGSSPYSPSESDSSSSSSSLFEESSTPCTSETSASSVKGELSPASVSTATPLRLSVNPMQPKPARARTSLQSHFDAMPISKWEAGEPAREGPPEDDCFLEFNFLEGRMIESLMDPPHALVSRSSCESSQQDSIRKQESSSIELSDEEWADGSTTPAFYSASAHSPESSSENSLHSGDASSLPSLDLEVKHVVVSKESAAEHDHSLSRKKTMDSDTLLHATHAPSHTVEDQKEACVSYDLHPERVESNSQTSSICVSRLDPKEDSRNSVAFEADIGVDRVFLKSDVQLKQTPTGTASDASLCGRSSFPQSFSFHSSPAKLESGFSFQPTPLLSASKLKGKARPSSQAFNKESFTKKGPSMNAGMLLVKSKLGTANRRVLEKQPISSTLFDRHISNVHPRDDKHKAKHEDGLKTSSVTFSSMMYHHHVVSPNVKNRSPLAHNLPNYLEKADEFTPVFPQPQHEDRTGIPANMQSSGTFKRQPAPAHTPLDWRSKSLSARASLRSAVRNLEAAFGGSSRSVSLPKARPHTTQKDSKPDSLRLLDRVFVSPMKSRLKHADPSKLAQMPPTPSGYFLQANDSRRSGTHSRKDAKAVSSSTLACGQMKPVAQLLPPINHRQNLEVSCKPFLPTSRSIHCLPSQKPSFVEVGTPSLDLKRPELLPSQSKVPSSMLQGYLQCILRDGVPCYALTMDNSDEVLLGRACVLERHSSKEGCSWMYTFQSAGCKSRAKGTGGWKNWIRKDNKSCTEVAGKMQVSSVLCPEVSPKGDISHSMVFEFVLFDGRVEDAGRTQSLRFSSSNMSCQEKPTSSMEGSPLSTSRVSVGFASPPSLSTVSTSPTGVEAGLRSSQSGLCSPMTANMGHRPSFSLDIWSDSELAGPSVERLSPSISHKELAAMVIRLHVDDNKTLTKLDDHSSSRDWLGWGLRFLDTEVGESGDNGYGVPRTLSLSAVNIVKYGAIAAGKTFGEDWLSPDYKLHYLMQRPDQKSSQANRKCVKVHAQHGAQQTSEYVSVLLPRGDHGLPNEGVSGPSSLIQRWRSGGKCDCGGWDLGCGLKVLSTDLVKNGTTSHSGKFLALSQDKPLNIFSQESDQEVMLSLTVVQQGLYVLSFQTELSPLRSFATAIAILHSKQFSSSSETWVKMGSLKERPICPSQSHLVPQTKSETHSDANPYLPAENPSNCPSPPLWSL